MDTRTATRFNSGARERWFHVERRFTESHAFIHSFGHFYSAPSSPLLLRGAPDYSTDTVSEFHAEAPACDVPLGKIHTPVTMSQTVILSVCLFVCVCLFLFSCVPPCF